MYETALECVTRIRTLGVNAATLQPVELTVPPGIWYWVKPTEATTGAELKRQLLHWPVIGSCISTETERPPLPGVAVTSRNTVKTRAPPTSKDAVLVVVVLAALTSPTPDLETGAIRDSSMATLSSTCGRRVWMDALPTDQGLRGVTSGSNSAGISTWYLVAKVTATAFNWERGTISSGGRKTSPSLVLAPMTLPDRSSMMEFRVFTV